MRAVSTIRKFLAAQANGADLVPQELTWVPSAGATDEELEAELAVLSRSPSAQYLEFLRSWNGINLEVVRLASAGLQQGGILPLSKSQYLASFLPEGVLTIGSDPSGFSYLEDSAGNIFQHDSDGGELKFLAEDFDSFISDLIFGQRADEFMGEEWLEQLQAAGLGRT